MSTIVMRKIPTVIIIVLALTFWVNYFTGEWGNLTDSIKIGSSTLWAFTNLLSALYFFVRAYPVITRRKSKYWILRGWAIVVAVIYIVVGLAVTQSGEQYVYLTNIILVAADRVSWLPMMFVMISIIRRTFVARDLSTTLYVLGAVLAYARATPVFTSNPAFLAFTVWFRLYVTTGLGRILTLGFGVSAITLIIRQFMGIERVKEGVT